jgi:hypothetical protein
MAKSRRISVTPNLEYALKILKKAVKSITDEDLKKEASDAVKYLDKTFKGEAQTMRGHGCTPPTRLEPPR